MSLSLAIELIQLELPAGVFSAIKRALESASSRTDLSLPGFSIYHVSSPENLKFIFERRLIGNETSERGKWLKEKIGFIERSFVTSTQKELWQSYCVTDAGTITFLIDVGRQTFCAGSFP